MADESKIQDAANPSTDSRSAGKESSGAAPSADSAEISHTEVGLPELRRTSPVPLPLDRYVPGYEILEEIGRGGMGVVYKAVQAGLHRVVALKMILAGGHAGVDQVQRFRREAEAVARLQHPNIVQIHEIGEHGGLPFFSLEFVAGGSLGRKLNGTPQQPRQAAQWVAVLARAVHAAHQQGVVHRDLKPGNVLLTTEGTLKITDFGLAKQLESDPGQGAQTRTGEVMGTPSYMASEQAAGNSKLIGPATDIYALGAILYEMLTGRPPFRAATAMDTIMQVLHEDPVAPRRLQNKVPVDLETICLKCLAKDPGKRYAGAGALADDLERFLAGQPILARPTSWWERALKWVRRRPAAAALLLVIVLTTVILLAGSWIVTARLQAERNVAERRLLQAMAAVDRMLTRVSEDKDLLANEPHMEPVRQKLLEDAVAFYQELMAEQSTDPRLRHETGKALFRVGKIRHLLGRFDQAKEAYDQALELEESLAGQFPVNTAYPKEIAAVSHAYGLTLREMGLLTQAEAMYLRSRDLYRSLLDPDPGNDDLRQGLAQTFNDLGNLLKDNSNSLEQSEEGIKAHEQALALREKLAADFPKKPEYQRDLSQSLHNVAYHWQRMNQRAKAEKLYRQAIVLRRELVKNDPKVPQFRQFLGRTLLNLSYVVQLDKRPKEAGEILEEALAIREKLVAEFPGVTKYREELGGSYENRAVLFSIIKEADKAMADINRALDIYKKLVDDHSQVPAYKKKLAVAVNERGFMFHEKDFKKALADYTEAIRLEPKLALPYRNRASLYATRLEFGKALEDFNLAIQLNPKDAECFNRRGYIYLFKAQPKQAIADFTSAIKLNPKFVTAYRNRALAYTATGQSAEAQADNEQADKLEQKKKGS
jgi:tetratricopeptide (TPR) repeat protein